MKTYILIICLSLFCSNLQAAKNCKISYVSKSENKTVSVKSGKLLSIKERFANNMQNKGPSDFFIKISPSYRWIPMLSNIKRQLKLKHPVRLIELYCVGSSSANRKSLEARMKKQGSNNKLSKDKRDIIQTILKKQL